MTRALVNRGPTNNSHNQLLFRTQSLYEGADNTLGFFLLLLSILKCHPSYRPNFMSLMMALLVNIPVHKTVKIPMDQAVEGLAVLAKNPSNSHAQNACSVHSAISRRAKTVNSSHYTGKRRRFARFYGLLLMANCFSAARRAREKKNA